MRSSSVESGQVDASHPERIARAGEVLRSPQVKLRGGAAEMSRLR